MVMRQIRGLQRRVIALERAQERADRWGGLAIDERVDNVMKRNGIFGLRDFDAMPTQRLWQMMYVGPKTITAIAEALGGAGASFSREFEGTVGEWAKQEGW